MRLATITLSALLLLAACSRAASLHHPFPAPEAHSTKSLAAPADLYDTTGLVAPDGREELVRIALHRADSLAADPSFLAAILAKDEWTHVGPSTTGADVAARLRTRTHVENGATVRPRITFYRPPRAGRDVCGGWSWWSLYRTSATGCTKDGDVYRNVESLSDDPDVLAGFFLHEWLHAAGYGHDGNSGQCGAEKRNSVPIHVDCLSQAHPDSAAMSRCSLSCSRAAAVAP